MTSNRQGASAIEILVVEDSETQAEQLAHLLESNGFTVRIASNGRDGLEQVRRARPAMIISDIAMPEMDGYEMCRALKSDAAYRDIPVILLTALSSLYDIIKGLDCGADNFIRKPFGDRSLLGRIRFILANREFRNNDRVQLGMRVSLGGQTHFITAERQQIFDLLISTYEEAIQLTEELRAQQKRIAHSYQSLESLYRIADGLNPALTCKEVAEKALDRALDLPGVLGGCILLRGSDDASFEVAAAQEFGRLDRLNQDCADCACQRKLVSGELGAPEVIRDCSRLDADQVHMSVPLTAGKRALGLLNLSTSADAEFVDEDLQVLHAVGSQIAVALERATLYSEMERLVRERTHALETQRNRFSAIVNTTGALVIATDLEGRIVEFNPAAERILGWARDEVMGRRTVWDFFMHPDRMERAKQDFYKVQDEGVTSQTWVEWRDRKGGVRTIVWSLAVLKDGDGKVERVLGTGLDVTELRRAEERVQYLSNFDVLTGLPNRAMLRGQARLSMERADSTAAVMGLLLIWMPRLKLVRESLGASAEQSLISEVAQRMKMRLDGRDTLARYGDDCFALLAVRADEGDLSALAREVLGFLEEPFQVDEQEIHMDVGVGIAVCPNDGKEFESLCQRAESAMRRASERTTERYEFYRPALNAGASERFKLESALRRALQNDEFILHYQPQVSLSTRKIIGVEALLRWQHPELGLLPPGQFIGLAEETGLILPIGEWVLGRACEQVGEWGHKGVPLVPVAVNLSARQFATSIAESVREILDRTKIDPGLLELELTESLSMEDPESTFDILRRLKAMGVKLAIDDFGTGYSNLNYLKRFPVDRLKLDRSFVRDLTFDPDDLAIARAVISMAHSLRLSVIAEGVESEGQLAVLAKHGCDEIQGYYFSRPVDADACAQLLREGRTLSIDTRKRQASERTLLLVEGELNLDDTVRRVLHNKGYRILHTQSPEAAFEMLATENVGVVLCDQGMPSMSGIEFLARVKQIHPHVIRMVLSGHADLQSVTDAVNRGAIFKFLGKPWDEGEFLRSIEDAFRELQTNSDARQPRVA